MHQRVDSKREAASSTFSLVAERAWIACSLENPISSKKAIFSCTWSKDWNMIWQQLWYPLTSVLEGASDGVLRDNSESTNGENLSLWKPTNSWKPEKWYIIDRELVKRVGKKSWLKELEKELVNFDDFRFMKGSEVIDPSVSFSRISWSFPLDHHQIKPRQNLHRVNTILMNRAHWIKLFPSNFTWTCPIGLFAPLTWTFRCYGITFASLRSTKLVAST